MAKGDLVYTVLAEVGRFMIVVLLAYAIGAAVQQDVCQVAIYGSLAIILAGIFVVVRVGQWLFKERSDG